MQYIYLKQFKNIQKSTLKSYILGTKKRGPGNQSQPFFLLPPTDTGDLPTSVCKYLGVIQEDTVLVLRPLGSSSAFIDLIALA